MITPGSIVIISGFIGYLAAGPLGDCAAVFAVFLPPYLLVIFAHHYRRFAKNLQVKTFVEDASAAAVGAIARAAVILSKRAMVDRTAVALALFSLFLLLVFKKVPESVLILGAGIAGILLHQAR